jgi:hypothetical protein
MASIPVALVFGHLTLAQLYVVSFLEGSLYVFFDLAETASLPRVVPCIIEAGREVQVYWKGMEKSNTAGEVNLSCPLSHELVP